jgi:hypothetical protein
MPGTSRNLKWKDLATDLTALASVTVNIKVPQLVLKLILHLIACQIKALRLLRARVQDEDDRTSFANSSRSVDVPKELRAAQAVVEELDKELVILHRYNNVTESGGHAAWALLERR